MGQVSFHLVDTNGFHTKTKKERFTATRFTLMIKRKLENDFFATEFKQKPWLQQRKGHLKIKMCANVTTLRILHITHFLYCSSCTLEMNEFTVVFFTFLVESYIWKLHIVVWQATSESTQVRAACRTRSTIIVFHSTNLDHCFLALFLIAFIIS